jgi:hypothetical protein
VGPGIPARIDEEDLRPELRGDIDGVHNILGRDLDLWPDPRFHPSSAPSRLGYEDALAQVVVHALDGRIEVAEHRAQVHLRCRHRLARREDPQRRRRVRSRAEPQPRRLVHGARIRIQVELEAVSTRPR